MTAYVVDASVAIKWFVPEIYSDAALRLCRAGNRLVAPDLMLIEAGSILWKKFRISEITQAQAGLILKTMKSLPLKIYPSGDILELALNVACALDRTVYDSLYLALAITLECQLVTADRRFQNAIEASNFAKHIIWVEAIPEW